MYIIYFVYIYIYIVYVYIYIVYVYLGCVLYTNPIWFLWSFFPRLPLQHRRISMWRWTVPMSAALEVWRWPHWNHWKRYRWIESSCAVRVMLACSWRMILCKGISPENMARNMVQYLHFRILKFPLKYVFQHLATWSKYLVKEQCHGLATETCLSLTYWRSGF